jgi:CheY-like chemotaxis protein
MPRVVDLSRTVRENTDLLRRLLGEGIELVTPLCAESACVRADPSQMLQVVLNLAINARDAMDGRGRITIATSRVDVDAATAKDVVGANAGPYVLLTVEDTGHGIDPNIRPHIFEPFFTTKTPGNGTGLGLSISYGIVRQSGGFITLDSEPGKGTTFQVYLPRTEAPESVEAPVDEEPVRGNGEVILLVEDENAVRSVAAQVLRRNAYHVIEAGNGAEALDKASAHDGEIDLLITDLVMPVMGGLDLAARLRRLRPHVRVIYTSGYANDAGDLHSATRTGMSFLPKPYVPGVLERRVRDVLRVSRR